MYDPPAGGGDGILGANSYRIDVFGRLPVSSAVHVRYPDPPGQQRYPVSMKRRISLTVAVEQPS